ncbi:MAG: hypothetical protein JWN36_3134, partial [Microbacteriaceae bacterium]|nr:hypothetical protein [Microbacteriaceae bacterium]
MGTDARVVLGADDILVIADDLAGAAEAAAALTATARVPCELRLGPGA